MIVRDMVIGSCCFVPVADGHWPQVCLIVKENPCTRQSSGRWWLEAPAAKQRVGDRMALIPDQPLEIDEMIKHGQSRRHLIKFCLQ